MILELPTYKTPSLRNALLAAKDQGVSFLATAGTVIVAICIVMWWLSTYPRVEPGPEVQTLRAQAAAPGIAPEQAEAITLQADTLEQREAQRGPMEDVPGGAAQQPGVNTGDAESDRHQAGQQHVYRHDTPGRIEHPGDGVDVHDRDDRGVRGDGLPLVDEASGDDALLVIAAPVGGDDVRPAIAVQVLGIIAKGIAVTDRIVLGW